MSDKTAAKKAPVLFSNTVKKNTSATNTVEETRKKLPGFSNAPAQQADTKAQPVLQNNADQKEDKKEFSIRSGGSIKRLRITSSSDQNSGQSKDAQEKPSADIMRATKNASASLSAYDASAYEGEPVLMLSPQNGMPMKRSKVYRAMHIGVTMITAIWFGLIFGYIHTQIGWGNLIAMEPPMLGGFVAGILAPIAFLWMFLAYMQRGADIQMYADNLRSELQSMLFPTEERAQVIHKDIEELCKQAAELSAASKSVLRSIHRARMGLRSEVNDFTGITKKTEFHIDRLSETLNMRSEKLLSIANDLERQTDTIDEKSDKGVKAWENAAEKILAKSGSMEEALSKGAEKIVSAANEADSKTQAVKDKMESGYKGFHDAIESISGKFDGFDSMLDNMKDVGNRIQDNREAMDVAVQDLNEKISQIADSLNSGIDKVDGVVGRMDKTADGFEARIDEKVEAIDTCIKGFDTKISNIEVIGQDTAKVIDRALAVAINGSQTVHGNIRKSVESIVKVTEDANTQSEKLSLKADEQVQRINAKADERAQEVAKTLALIEESTKRVENLSQESNTRVDTLVKALDEQIEKMNLAKARLTGGLDNISTVFDEPLNKIRDSLEHVSATQVEIEENLAKRIETLSETAKRNTSAAQEVGESLRKHAQDISTMTGQIAAHTHSVNDELEQQKHKIQNFISVAENDIKSVTELANQKVEALNAAAVSSAKSIRDVTDNMDSAQNILNSKAVATQEQLTALNISMENIAQRIDTSSLKALESMHKARSEAMNIGDVVTPVYDDVLQKANDVNARLTALKSEMNEASEANTQMMSKAGLVFDERLQSLSAGSKDAALLLETTSETMKARVEDIENASRMAEDSMRKIEQTLDSQATDMHLLSDQAVLKIQSVQKSVNTQFHELTEQVAQAVVQIEGVGKTLVNQKDQVKHVAESLNMQIDGIREKAQISHDALSHSIKQTADMTDSLVDHVRKETANLLKASESDLKVLKDVGDGLALRTSEVNAHIAAAAKTSQDYALKLEEQVHSISATSTEAADKISGAINVVSKHMDQVSKDTKSVISDIQGSQSALFKQTDNLLNTSQTAVKNVADAANDLGRQSTALFKAVQDADQAVEKIRKSEWHAQRDAFMGSAKFIVESLHSLSVDITRIMKKSLPEKTWKAYQKGDVSAFTARLAAMDDKFPQKDVQAKYDADSEFRSYVNRFIRQFEEVYAQADKNDHGALLVSTFASSDIGKLYERLCSSTGHASKIQGQKKVA